MPDIPNPMNMFDAEIDVGYDIDPSISYGGFMGVDFVDKPTSGIALDGKGSMEILFNNNGSFRSIGLQLDANVLNVPMIGTFGYGLGCMSYIDADKQFVGDLFAEVKDNPILCSHGHLHIDISNSSYHVNLASKEKPVVIQPFCANGPARLEGYFDLNPQNFSIGLGLDVRAGVKASFKACEGCDVWASASLGFEADVYASIVYEDDFYLDEAYVHVGMHASVDVGTSGAVCGSHDWTIASLSIDGSLRYKHKPNQNIKGTLSGSVNFLDIVKADVDLKLDKNLK